MSERYELTAEARRLLGKHADQVQTALHSAQYYGEMRGLERAKCAARAAVDDAPDTDLKAGAMDALRRIRALHPDDESECFACGGGNGLLCHPCGWCFHCCDSPSHWVPAES